MIIETVNRASDADHYLVFAGSGAVPSISPEVDRAIALMSKELEKSGDVKTIQMPIGDRLVSVAAVKADDGITPRKLHLAAAKAFKTLKEYKAEDIAIYLDGAPDIARERALFETVARMPELVSYTNNGRKSHPKIFSFRSVKFITEQNIAREWIDSATFCAEGTVIARTLANERADSQTPETLAASAADLGKKYGFEVEVFDKAAIEKLGMHAFLAVGRGGHDAPPALIVMRHLKGGDAPRIALIGKGIVYDSGGYSLKPNASMKNMYVDMAGGAAVIGAMTAIARSDLAVNAIAIIAACENKLAHDAYKPGDIISSMAGKSIEITNTDAEGRVTLVDAITYAIRNEKCDILFDIATLTGAARGAVGKFSSAVFATDDDIFGHLKTASTLSCEKVWRLDLDDEMASCLKSPVADSRNSTASTTDGGGSILGALFMLDYTEGKPWVHVDMASVSQRDDAPAFSSPGATGYGAALAYHFAKSYSR